ncbi:MAG: hypothetical protein KIS92_21390, partial [Planctomycetota bacterium]|nr:hypothetical protein [Planctomycetota bacterium]
AYQERVQATNDLGALPVEALPAIEEEGKKWRADPEVAARIAEVRQRMGLKALKTKDEVLAYLQKRIEAAARDGRFGTAQSVLKEGLEKLKDLTPAKEWPATQAKVYDDAGRFYYKAGQAGQRKAFLEEAEKMLSRANDAYEEALKAEPNNKDFENAQVECNMLLYASRKYQDLQRSP